MPELNQIITVGRLTGTVYCLDPTGRKVLLKLENGRTIWVKLP